MVETESGEKVMQSFSSLSLDVVDCVQFKF